MAKVRGAWGIDLGQCALKALRCHVDPANPGKVIADAFDYIEYPRILSQPEAEPAALIRDALALFLSRNQVLGDRVAISVSGSSGLSRFIKLPPVETKKIPDIVQYEAKQQIPFDLNDVIWDYQRMYGGIEEEGFALATEVGLFAMKRDQVYQALEPLRDAGIDVEIVQLTPLAIYNFLVFDQLGGMSAETEFDPDDPPPSIMALSLGTETTDLVVTNGFRVWQRNIPIGGSHFTKALTKELKLTYAKAEHLKRNATHAEDPKAVYQAMRPVFKDLLTEIQRSVGFFHSLDRSAKISHVVAMGNSMKLAGLKRYLAQNLGLEVHEVNSLKSLGGPTVTGAPAFRNNVLCFGVAYGLALQGLDKSNLSTNLVPVEMVRDRIIEKKQPWALAGSVLLALCAAVSFLLLWWPSSQVRVDTDPAWTEAVRMVEDTDRQTQKYIDEFGVGQAAFRQIQQRGDELVGRLEQRLNWADLLQTLNQCLPQSHATQQPLNIQEREEIHLLELRAQPMADLSAWAAQVGGFYGRDRQVTPLAAPEAVPGQQPGVGGPSTPRLPPSMPPSGPGYVVQLRGYHLHNGHPDDAGADFLRRRLLERLDGANVQVSAADGGGTIEVSVRELGISYPVIVAESEMRKIEVSNPAALVDPNRPDHQPEPNAPLTIEVPMYEFTVQFAWQPRIPLARQQGRVVFQRAVGPGEVAGGRP